MASQGKALQAVVLASLVGGGYWLLRGRHRYDPLSPQFDYDTHPTTRHMVGLSRRVDKERVQRFLDAQEGGGVQGRAGGDAGAGHGGVQGDEEAK